MPEIEKSPLFQWTRSVTAHIIAIESIIVNRLGVPEDDLRAAVQQAKDGLSLDPNTQDTAAALYQLLLRELSKLEQPV